MKDFDIIKYTNYLISLMKVKINSIIKYFFANNCEGNKKSIFLKSQLYLSYHYI